MHMKKVPSAHAHTTEKSLFFLFFSYWRKIWILDYVFNVSSCHLLLVPVRVPLTKWSMMFMGMGKMMVELCSAAMLFSVWR